MQTEQEILHQLGGVLSFLFLQRIVAVLYLIDNKNRYHCFIYHRFVVEKPSVFGNSRWRSRLTCSTTPAPQRSSAFFCTKSRPNSQLKSKFSALTRIEAINADGIIQLTNSV